MKELNYFKSSVSKDFNIELFSSNLIDYIHRNGPDSPYILESLACIKKFHPDYFLKYEEFVISAIGLFYKIRKPDSLYAFLMESIGVHHQQVFGEKLTPVQASIRRAIEDNLNISISAPTSSGKSYSIRDYIFSTSGDVVIVVPSRALIGEYVSILKNKFRDRKDVLVYSFVDDIYRSRNLKKIFVLTPERAIDLFSLTKELNVDVFFFDEAQISDDKYRGVNFDYVVRKARDYFPLSKFIFAHPFVENPSAQIEKHGFSHEDSFSKLYSQGTVGKLFIKVVDGDYYYFSPYFETGHYKKNSIKFDGSFKDFSFRGDKTVLVFVSKASLYRGDYINEFFDYISSYPEISDISACDVISKIENIIGSNNSNYRSNLIGMLRRGVVIHHGSVPLEVRFLLEELIRGGFIKICFATSTLVQGVNMPFDVVWMSTMSIPKTDGESISLAFKNLIGRSGRLTDLSEFDYGYVFTKSSKLACERINEKVFIREKSVIDDLDYLDADAREVAISISNNTFDTDLKIPKSRIDRISSYVVFEICTNVLNLLYSKDSYSIHISGSENQNLRDSIKSYLCYLYQIYIGRDLKNGELSIFKEAITILFHTFSGRKFKEIVALRYEKAVSDDWFVQKASKLPDSNLNSSFPVFSQDERKLVNYDAIVFDTYDYLDKVISFSLLDPFISIFKIYKKYSKDYRADRFIEILRYGTNNSVHIMLTRYGFSSEFIPEISKHIQFVDEESIRFKPSIYDAPEAVRDMVSWYLD